MLGDVTQREVVAHEAHEQHDRGHRGRRERAVEGVAGGVRQPTAVADGGERSRDQGIGGQPERDEKRRATELGHGYCSALGGATGVYFDGHFVTIEPGTATNVPFFSSPSTTRCRPTLKRSGTEPV